jgi:hypothetical protein
MRGEAVLQTLSFQVNSQVVDFIILLGKYTSNILKLRVHIEF